MDGVRGGVFVGRGGDSLGTKKVIVADSFALTNNNNNIALRAPNNNNNNNNNAVRESLRFFFSDEGELFREFVIDEISNGIDAISRDAVRELFMRLGFLLLLLL